MLNLKNIINGSNARGKTARVMEMKSILDEKIDSVSRLLQTKNNVNRQNDYHYLTLAVEESTAPVNDIDYVHPVVKPMVDYSTAVIAKGLAPNGDINFEFVPDNEMDSDAARQATNMVSKIINEYNDPHKLLNHWIMDSLLHKNGLMLISPSVEKTIRYSKITGKMDELQAFEAQATDAGLEATRTSRKKVGVDLESVMMEMTQYAQVAPLQEQMEQMSAMNMGVDMDDEEPETISNADEALAEATNRHTIYEAEFKLVGNNVNIRFRPIAQHYWVCDPTVVNIQDQPFCGFRQPMTIAEAEAQYPDIDLEAFAEYSEYVEGQENASHHLAIHARDSVPVRGMMSGTTSEGDDLVDREIVVSTIWAKHDIDNDGDLELIEITYSGDYVICAKEVEFIPVANMCPRPLPQNFFGMSLAESLIPAQEYATAAHRAEITLGLLTATPRIGVKPDKVDVEMFQDGESSVFLLDKNFDPSTDVYPLPAPSGNIAFIDTALSRIEKDTMGLVGMTTPQDVFNPEVMSAGNSGAKLAMAMGPNQLIQDNTIKNAASGLQDAIWCVWRTLLQYSEEYSVKKMAATYHYDGVPVFIDAEEFDNFNFAERKLVNIELATGMRSEENNVQRLQLIQGTQEKLYATVQAMVSQNTLTPEVFAKIKKPYEDTLYTLGVKDCDSYLPTDEEIMAMIQQAQEAAMNKQPSPDEQATMAKAQLDQARAQEIAASLPMKQQESMMKMAKAGIDAEKTRADVENSKVNTRLNLADALGNTAERKLELAAQSKNMGTNY
jgi:hypothetical protein